MEDEFDDLCTVQAAAEVTGLAEQTIRNALLRGALPFIEKYGRKLIRRTDLMAYLERTGGKVGRPPAEREEDEPR